MTRKLISLSLILYSFITISSCDNIDKHPTGKDNQKMYKSYQVKKLRRPISIDGNFDKPQWQKVKPLYINEIIGPEPKFKPKAQVKLLYDDENLYVCFKVEDRYIRAITTSNYGPVWEDTCVEFFFTPGQDIKKGYLNFETNCIGMVMFRHQTGREENVILTDPADLAQVEMAHSLPKKAIDPENPEPITWTMEYRLPLKMLEKYHKITKPAPGVKWLANFYKCGSNASNPHWMTWSRIDKERPDFHRPEYFGTLEFVD